MTATEGPLIVVRGGGSAGRRHLRLLNAIEPGSAVGAPVRPASIDEFRRLGLPVIGPSGAQESVIGAIVATDTGRHTRDVVDWLTRGPVLCEKPLSVSTNALAPMAAAIEETGHQIYAAYCLRFDSALRVFAEHLPMIGPIHTVRIEAESFLPDWRPGTDHRAAYSARAEEGGVLRDLSHELDYAVWLFGRPTEVAARVRTTGTLGIAADDVADLWWVTGGGATVSVHVNYLTRTPRRRIRAAGAEGEISWDGVTQSVSWSVGGSDHSRTFADSPDDKYVRQARVFLDACRGGEPHGLATFDEGAFIVELIDAAFAASANGRPAVIGAANQQRQEPTN